MPARPSSPRRYGRRSATTSELEHELGGYEATDARADALRQAYGSVGRLLGASGRNVAMQQNSTVAFTQAFAAFDLHRGDQILTSRADYASNQIMYLALPRRVGVEIVRAPDAPEGGIDPQAVREMVRRRRPTLLALSWIPTNSGLVQPAETIGEICREAGVPYIVDACQAVGQIPVSVDRLRCDYLAAATRKFLRGPRVSAFLRLRSRARGRCVSRHVDMHGADWTESDDFALKPDARRFEGWEISHALVLGGSGRGVRVRHRHRAGTRPELGARGLRSGPAVAAWMVCGSSTVVRSSVPSPRPSWAGGSGGSEAGAARSTHQHQLSLREDAVIDMDEKRAASAIRISPHYYNTATEIDTALAALGEVMETMEPTPRA